MQNGGGGGGKEWMQRSMQHSISNRACGKRSSYLQLRMLSTRFSLSKGIHVTRFDIFLGREGDSAPH